MKIAVNAVSAKLGGAVTYLQNLLPEVVRQLPTADRRNKLVVWRGAAATGDQAWPASVEYRESARATGGVEQSASIVHRLWFDQVELPQQLRAERADVLFSSANFGTLRCPCRQVLLICNTLPLDRTYYSRMPAKARAHLLLQRRLMMLSIKASDVVLFPTRAIRDLTASYFDEMPANWAVSHFGTRPDIFYPATERRPDAARPVRLLHVSLYCEQKNLLTLLEAVKRLQAARPGDYSLRLTAGFEKDEVRHSPFAPNFAREQALFYELHAAGVAEDMRRRKYGTLPELYRDADIFVFPSYTESFGFPLVEAMSSGLAVVAADVPVNRELCGEAAIYFSPFDAEDCAGAIRRMAEDAGLRRRLSDAAMARAKAFAWSRHAAELVQSFESAVRNSS